jgi:hypothetical protein
MELNVSPRMVDKKINGAHAALPSVTCRPNPRVQKRGLTILGIYSWGGCGSKPRVAGAQPVFTKITIAHRNRSAVGHERFFQNRHFISHSLRENSPYRLDLDRLRPSSSRSPWPATGKPPPAAALVAADALGFRLLFLRIACYPACGRSWLFNGCFAGAGKGCSGPLRRLRRRKVIGSAMRSWQAC